MTLQEVEKSLEAAWASLVAEVHSLFHKAPIEAVSPDKGQDPSPPSPPAEAPPAQAISDPVVAPVVTPAAPVVAPVTTGVDPTTAMFGDPNAIDPRFPNGTQSSGDLGYNPNQRALSLADQGHLFNCPQGDTSFSIEGPIRISVIPDGAQNVGETVQYSIDGSSFESQIGTGFVGQVGAGSHTLVVRHNVTQGYVRVEVNPA